MEHDEFVGQIQHRARLASRGEAQREFDRLFEAGSTGSMPGHG